MRARRRTLEKKTTTMVSVRSVPIWDRLWVDFGSTPARQPGRPDLGYNGYKDLDPGLWHLDPGYKDLDPGYKDLVPRYKGLDP